MNDKNNNTAIIGSIMVVIVMAILIVMCLSWTTNMHRAHIIRQADYYVSDNITAPVYELVPVGAGIEYSRDNDYALEKKYFTRKPIYVVANNYLNKYNNHNLLYKINDCNYHLTNGAYNFGKQLKIKLMRVDYARQVVLQKPDVKFNQKCKELELPRSGQVFYNYDFNKRVAKLNESFGIMKSGGCVDNIKVYKIKQNQFVIRKTIRDLNAVAKNKQLYVYVE